MDGQGEVTHMGTYQELITSSFSFAHLLHDINQHELKEQQSIDLQNRKSTIDLTISETDDQKEVLSPPTNVEIKQEGVVKLHVYTAYLRAGVGLFIGFVLMTSIFSARELVNVFSDRWLAIWSDDESHRHRLSNNCTKTSKSAILSMGDTEWNDHRNRRFYIYCGMFIR